MWINIYHNTNVKDVYFFKSRTVIVQNGPFYINLLYDFLWQFLFVLIYITFNPMKALRTLMTSVATDWRSSGNTWERNTMLNIARRGRSLSFKCCVAATCTVTFYVSFNLIKFYRNMYLPQRNLVYRFSYPYNIQKSPNYEITFFIQLSGGVYSAIINCTVDCFISILLLHVCAQLINLRTTLNNLVDKLANRSISSLKFKEGLTAIAIRHQHLIRYAKGLPTITKWWIHKQLWQ